MVGVWLPVLVQLQADDASAQAAVLAGLNITMFIEFQCPKTAESVLMFFYYTYASDASNTVLLRNEIDRAYPSGDIHLNTLAMHPWQRSTVAEAGMRSRDWAEGRRVRSEPL